MQKPICPICATGKCKFRNGIICGAWICASGMMTDGRQNQTGDDDQAKSRGPSLDEMLEIFGVNR